MAAQEQMTRSPQQTRQENKLTILDEAKNMEWLQTYLAKDMGRGQPKMVGGMLLKDTTAVYNAVGENMTKTQAVAMSIYHKWRKSKSDNVSYSEMLRVLNTMGRNDITTPLTKYAEEEGKDLKTDPVELDVFLEIVCEKLTPANANSLGLMLLNNFIQLSEAKLQQLNKEATPEEQMMAIIQAWVTLGKGEPKDLVRAVNILGDKKLKEKVQEFVNGLDNNNIDNK